MSSQVDEIKQRIDIVDLVQETVPLRPAGNSMKAKCPFHNEKSPSFMVSRERGSWHCFGCGRGGDIFAFVQELEGVDFLESLRILAKRAGVKLENRDPKLQDQTSKILDVLRWVTRYWQEVLHKSSEAEAARTYVKTRGIDSSTADLFLLGYAPEGWDTTYQALRKKGFSDDIIFQAGLTIKKDRGGYIDRFRSRLMFPIADAHGNVVGFTGRILQDEVGKNGQPLAKYVNSPQTATYNKSAVLYGFDKAKSSIKKTGVAVIVEGNMDCLTSHQFGVENVVAMSGTALTQEQILLLKRGAKKLVFAFDQDAAGFQAIIRALDHALQSGLDITILRLPFGKDPDELIRKDVVAWQKAIAEAQSVMEYFFAVLTEHKNLGQVDDKKQLVRELLPIVAKVGDVVEQNHYLEKLSNLVHVPIEDLRRSFPKQHTPQKPGVIPAVPASVAPDKPDRFSAISERVVAMLVADPGLIEAASRQLDPSALIGEDLKTLYKSFVIWYTQQHIVDRHQLDRLVAEGLPELGERYQLLSLLADKEFPSSMATDRDQELLSLTSTLKRQSLVTDLYRLEADIRRLEQQPGGANGQDMTTLLNRVRTLTEQLRSIG